MKIDFTASLTGLSGEPIKTRDESGAEVDMTLGMVAINVLLTPLPCANGQPENLPATDKVRLAKLAQDIFTATGPIDVAPKDVAMLQDRIGIACTPLTVMRAFALLDPQE